MTNKGSKKSDPTKQNFLEGEFNLPQLEEKVLKFWDQRKIFEKSLSKNAPETKTAKTKNFVFYEGPPYANGKPALHHVLARVVKDVILRYKTMRGYYVPRRAGWDTHGLPVEMAAEKALGFKTKKDIEAYGVERFNEKAKEQVWINKDDWERLTNRIGYWLDLKNAYVTYAPEYIETIWWTLAEIYKKGLLYKGKKVVPWCTRCGTSLSSHELALGYKMTTDRSVYVKFKLKPGQKIGNFETDDKTYILSWTTTPWTLPGNVALAVGEKIKYISTKQEGETLIVADALRGVLPEGSSRPIVAQKEFLGKDLLGLEYEPLFDVAPLKSELSYKIYPADFVTTTDGTGVVHTAVMYGEDDYELGKKIGLPQHHTVNEEGKFMKNVPLLSGLYVRSKEAEGNIFAHLTKNGNLLTDKNYDHEYPYCWRCGTAILYYARTSWFIAMSKLRKELSANNQTINWMPEYVRDGTFGEWLREAKDWNLSRERYWGAPLPIWECEKCEHIEVVGSLDELSKLSGGSKNNYWIMRHGEAENNALRVIDSGPANFHLTAKGKKQAQASAAKFKKELGKKKLDLIFASDILRAKETSEIVSKELGVQKVHFDKRLREMSLGAEFEKLPVEKYWEAYPTDGSHFRAVTKDGESPAGIRKRIWSLLIECEEKYKGKNILIISHGDPLYLLSQAAMGLSEKAISIDHDRLYLDTGELRPLAPMTIPRNENGEVDLHRPFADRIFPDCPQCEGTMRRVPAVADVWYDSGAMPFAQIHYPFAFAPQIANSQEQRANQTNHLQFAISNLPFPADYIAEGMDQTRGWFYTMIAISTALGYGAPYKNVITFGLMNDKFGNKMSKSKGNVIEPFAIIDKYGVDAVRWYFYSGTPFGEPKNFDELDVAKALRKMHLIVYNSLIFWKTYAEQESRIKNQGSGMAKNVLDRWIVARLNELTDSITQKLDKYQIREAALGMESFIDDLSRWYIRRSRRRLQRPTDKKDYEAASATLGYVLLSFAKLTAPFTPFFAEMLYSELSFEQESVHLDTWPDVDAKLIDKKLLIAMKAVRDFAALGLAKRAEAGIKVRQPLGLMKVGLAGLTAKDDELLQILADEVNVKKIIIDAKIKSGVELDTTITPELREEGWMRDVARMVQELRQTAGLEPKDKIALMVQLPENVRNAVSKNEAALKSDVGATSIEYKKSDKFTAEQEVKIEGQDAWIGIRKI